MAWYLVKQRDNFTFYFTLSLEFQVLRLRIHLQIGGSEWTNNVANYIFLKYKMCRWICKFIRNFRLYKKGVTIFDIIINMLRIQGFTNTACSAHPSHMTSSSIFLLIVQLLFFLAIWRLS